MFYVFCALTPRQSWWNKVPWYNGTQTLVPGVTPDAVAPEAKKAVKNEEPRAPQSPAPKAKVDKTKKPPPVIPFLKYSSPGPPKSEWTREDCSKPAFRILSLDGGGVRGALTTVILQRIIAEVPTFMDNVDLIAGTSTGGLIGLMLAAGYSPAVGARTAVSERVCWCSADPRRPETGVSRHL